MLGLDPAFPMVPIAVVPLVGDGRAVQALLLHGGVAVGMRLPFQGVKVGAGVWLRQMQMLVVR